MGGVARGEYAPISTTATTDVLTRYGIGEALLNHPIYGPELRKIVQLLNAKDYAAADVAYYNSAWGKLDADAKRNIFLSLENTNLYKERLKSWMINIKKQMTQLGLTATDSTLEQYFLNGIDDATILDELASGITPSTAAGTTADALTSLRATARANGFNLDIDFANQLADWTQRLAKGEPVTNFERLIREQAKLGLPQKVQGLLDEGLDLANIFAPYRNVMSSLLELTPDSIDLNDPLLRSAYGPDAEVSLYDFKKAVRKDPRWQYTDNAREDVSNVALKVLRDFGFQG